MADKLGNNIISSQQFLACIQDASATGVDLQILNINITSYQQIEFQIKVEGSLILVRNDYLERTQLVG